MIRICGSVLIFGRIVIGTYALRADADRVFE